MKILVVSGIWPPDVGGPASHAPEVAAFLQERGHEVEAAITADAAARARALPGALGEPDAAARCAPRRDRPPAALARAALGRRLHDRDARPLLARLAARADAVRDEAHGRSRPTSAPAAGGSARGRSRSSRRSPGARTAPLRLARDADVRRAAHVVTPSAYLRELAVGWGVDPGARVAAPESGAAASRARAARGAAQEVRLRRADPRLRRPAHRAEVARPRDRGRAPGRRGARDRRRRARPGRRSRRSATAASSARSPVARCSSSSAPAMPRCSPRRGRTSRTRSSSRSRWGRR